MFSFLLLQSRGYLTSTLSKQGRLAVSGRGGLLLSREMSGAAEPKGAGAVADDLRALPPDAAPDADPDELAATARAPAAALGAILREYRVSAPERLRLFEYAADGSLLVPKYKVPLRYEPYDAIS